MGFPKTLIEFQEEFPDDASCWKALRRPEAAGCRARAGGVGNPDSVEKERGPRGGREVAHKTAVAVAVEQRRHMAGSAWLAVLEGVSPERDLGWRGRRSSGRGAR